MPEPRGYSSPRGPSQPSRNRGICGPDECMPGRVGGREKISDSVKKIQCLASTDRVTGHQLSHAKLVESSCDGQTCTQWLALQRVDDKQMIRSLPFARAVPAGFGNGNESGHATINQSGARIPPVVILDSGDCPGGERR